MAKKFTGLVPLMLRIPEQLRARLEREAARNDRSMNSEINDRLQRTLDLEKQFEANSRLMTAWLQRDARMGRVLGDLLDGQLKLRGFPDADREELVTTVRAYFAENRLEGEK